MNNPRFLDPTIDKAFKNVMKDDECRNHFLKSFLESNTDIKTELGSETSTLRVEDKQILHDIFSNP